MYRVIAVLYRIKPYNYAALGIAVVGLLVLFVANGFFAEHFSWTPTRGR